MAVPTPAPNISLASEFPQPEDRIAGVFNAKALSWANTARAMASDMNAAGAAAYTNAQSAAEDAVTAQYQAGQAGLSATAASNSAISAASSKNTFDKYFLGAKSSPPAVDNAGMPLVAGATYFHTGVKQFMIYDGSAWDVAAGVSGSVDIGALIHASAVKATPADSDELVLSDSSASWVEKKLTWSQLKVALADELGSGGPRPIKDHGSVATSGSQTVTCDVQESDFHIMSMATANATGTLTISFTNIPDTTGKHFSWHARIRRGGRKAVSISPTVSWAGGAPTFGSGASTYDTVLFYQVDNGGIRAMVIDAW